jgi:hypothetical protein
MTKDKHYGIHHVIHSISNIKKYNYSYNEKNIFTEKYIFLTQ